MSAASLCAWAAERSTWQQIGRVDTSVRRKFVPLKHANMLYLLIWAVAAAELSRPCAKTAYSCSWSKPGTLPMSRRRARLALSTLPRLCSQTGDSGKRSKIGSQSPRKTNWE